MAGHTVLGGVDANPAAAESFKQTFPDAMTFCNDLQDTKSFRAISKEVLRSGAIDVLLGGPPCQAFSVYNHRRSIADPRAHLFFSFLEIATHCRPKWIILENVPGLISISDGRFWKKILRSFRARGYAVGFSIFNSCDMGVPQRRKRLVLIANRSSCQVSRVVRELTNVKIKPITVWDAIGDLPPEIGNGLRYLSNPGNRYQKVMRSSQIRFVPDHQSLGLGPINRNRLKYIPSGGNWRNIPRRLLPKGMMRAKLTDHTTRYGRLDYTKQSFTLLTKPDPHWGCFLHPVQDRVISVRESSRLQSLPDWISPSGNLTEKYRMIGNAVPPLFAFEILQRLQ